MTKMVRKQLYIEPEQQRKLCKLAARWGCTEAEVVRTAIDRLPDQESAIDARLRDAGLLLDAYDDQDLPAPEAADDMEEELRELLMATGPLHLTEAVIEDRR